MLAASAEIFGIGLGGSDGVGEGPKSGTMRGSTMFPSIKTHMNPQKIASLRKYP